MLTIDLVFFYIQSRMPSSNKHSKQPSTAPLWRNSLAKETLRKMLEEDQYARIKNMKPDDVLAGFLHCFKNASFQDSKQILLAWKKGRERFSHPSGQQRQNHGDILARQKSHLVTALLLQTDSDGKIHRMDPQDAFKMSNLFKPITVHFV